MSNEINKDEVRRIAQLANIGLDEDETAKLQKEMESVLEYVGTLKEMNTDNTQPTSHTINLVNVSRKDAGILSGPRKNLQSIEQGKFLDQAPEKHKEFFKTHPIFVSKK